MKTRTKKIEELTIADLEAFQVWQYANDEEKHDETAVRPVKKTPVKNLKTRFVSTQVLLANGAAVWALIGNVDASNPRLTQHFLTLSVLRKGRWFTMARYHDFDSNERGPQALATFLGLRVDEVFPISYDISRFCLGDSAALLRGDDQAVLVRSRGIRIVASCRCRFMRHEDGWKGTHARHSHRRGRGVVFASISPGSFWAWNRAQCKSLARRIFSQDVASDCSVEYLIARCGHRGYNRDDT